MKYVKQFCIICLISFMGEILNKILPFSIPGSIYGMGIMFLLLFLGFLKLDYIKEVSEFLINIMPVLFIPSAVGIIKRKEELLSVWWKMGIVIFLTTIIGMSVSGIVTQKIIYIDKKKKEFRIRMDENIWIF